MYTGILSISFKRMLLEVSYMAREIHERLYFADKVALWVDLLQINRLQTGEQKRRK